MAHIECDPVDLTAKLIRCETVTPAEGGALQLLDQLLQAAGFECRRVDRNGTCNLFARWGAKGAPRSFGFNGHTDVVPVGDEAAWTYPPFSGVIENDAIWGRGAADMKSGVAAFVAAAIDMSARNPDGAIILAITGDEEGPATDGTTALLDDMREHNETMTHCLVGEPTCPHNLGDMIKIGRRGSMNAWITLTGIQGHAAYPHRAKNPVPVLARLMDQLSSHRLDDGTDHFDPSTLAVVSIETGNDATNVIPAQCHGTLNIRFNDLHSGDSLTQWLQTQTDQIAKKAGLSAALKVKISGESFITEPDEFTQLVTKAIKAETGLTPELSTSGGTSDARFVKNHCPVLEFGLVGQTMHQVDEHVAIDDIRRLKRIYARILDDYFA